MMKYSTVPMIALVLLCLAGIIILPACISMDGQAGKLIYEDDFSDSNRGWITSTNEIGGGKYSSGQYILYLNKLDMMQMSARESMQDVADFAVEVDCAAQGQPGEGSIGELIYMIQGKYNGFYTFGIRPGAGTFAIGRKYNGKWDYFVNFPYSVHVNKGQATNKLKVTCLNSEVSVFLNDTVMATFTDRTFKKGKVGLAVESSGVPSCSYAFDNFKLYSLP